MLRSRSLWIAALLALMVATVVQAEPIVSVGEGGPGPSGLAVGGANNQILAVSWTQSSTFTDVIIHAVISTSDPSINQGIAWLTQSIGPGTLPGSELAQNTVTFPSVGAPPATLFSDMTLGPGTWYLILNAPAATTFDLGWHDGNGLPVTGAGVTTGETLWTLGQFADPAYAPGSNFIGSYPSLALAFSVDGRELPTTVPEPASLMLTGCGLLTLARIAYRRTRAS